MTTDRFCRVAFHGPFSVKLADGSDVTPKGVKARALLALLAEAPDRRRCRRWIEGKLWSDSSPKQASGCLRQTLHEIRTAFGAARDILGSSRTDVWLDAERVCADIDAGSAAPGRGHDLLEGLDVGDEEFEEWLRLLRQRHGTADLAAPATAGAVRAEGAGAPPPGHRGLRLRCRVEDGMAGAERMMARILSDQIGRNMEDSVTATACTGRAEVGEIDVATEVTGDGDGWVALVRIVQPATQRILYTGFRRIPAAADTLISDTLIAEFAGEAAARATARLPLVFGLDRPEVAAADMAARGRKLIFSYRPELLPKADSLLEQAFETDPNGLYLGWRVFVRMAEVIESLAPCPPEVKEEVDAMLRRAEALSPENGQVLALKSLARTMLFDDVEAGMVEARRAFRRNPNNLLVRQTLAMAAAAAGDAETAYRMSRACRASVLGDESSHLWDLYHSLVCIATGRLQEAVGAAERSARTCPDFRAPRRQLIGLHMHLDNVKAASEHLNALKRRETAFSVERYLKDPDYPATTLRNAGLLGFAPDRLPH